MHSKLILGTAMWGWTMPKERCFKLLDAYYQLGGREVDTATNYPINKKPQDFRQAETILRNWLTANGVKDMKVMMKIGSLNNLRTPDHNLTPSFLMMAASDYQSFFGRNLSTLMIHWDNRNQSIDIEKSLEVLSNLQKEGLNIGFSGLKHPQLYAEALKTTHLDTFQIQIKHNLLYSDYDRYQPLQDKASFIAYGINAGGLKLQQTAYKRNASLTARGGKKETHLDLIKVLNELLQKQQKTTSLPMPKRMNHLGLLYALYHPAIEQVLLGVSSIEQLEDTYQWVEQLDKVNYTDLYDDLDKLVAHNAKK